MANGYDPTVSFSDEEIGTTDKLNQLASNQNIIYNIVPHFLYRQGSSSIRDFSTAQASVLKPTIFTGRYYFQGISGKYGQSRNIYFPPGTFAPGCLPVVNITASARGHERYVTTTIASTTGSAHVRNEGFRVQLYHRDGEKFKTGGVSIHYMAFGWQEA